MFTIILTELQQLSKIENNRKRCVNIPIIYIIKKTTRKKNLLNASNIQNLIPETSPHVDDRNKNRKKAHSKI